MRASPFMFILLSVWGMAAVNAQDAKFAASLAAIDKLLEKGDYSNAHQAREDLARAAAKAERYEIASKQYELLLAARPRKADRIKFSTRLGHIHMARKDYSRAIAAYEDALHDSPKDWDANLSRARAFSASDINQRAIESYKRCIQLRSQESVSYEEIAMVYEKQGFMGKALSYYEKALLLDPQPRVYLRMADCYVGQKNFPKAIEILAQGKSRLPQADYDVRLGEIYEKQGEMKLAAKAWEDSLKSDAKRDDVRLRLSLLYDQNGRREDADRLIKELLVRYPRSPLVRYVKAFMYLERGEKVSARQEAMRVQELSPTELVEHYNELLLNQTRTPS
jgi:tetratricopeptide (TPR) repeat protein